MKARRIAHSICLLVSFTVALLAMSPGWLQAGEPPMPDRDTGMLHMDVGAMTVSATTAPGPLYRYPAKYGGINKSWKLMVFEEGTYKAYFRDLWVGQKTYIRDAVDGDEWTATATLPDGSTRNWGAIRFYSLYNGMRDCFVSPFWVVEGSRNIDVLWYTNSQGAPTGDWQFQFFFNGAPLFPAPSQFHLFPRIPPQTDVDDRVPLYAQRDYSDTYDHSWLPWIEDGTIASKGCCLTSLAMVVSYHGTTMEPDELNDFLCWNSGYSLRNGSVVFPTACAKLHEQGKAALTWGGYMGADSTSLRRDIWMYGPQILKLDYEPGHTHYVVALGWDESTGKLLINDSVDAQEKLITGWMPDGSFNGYRRVIGPEYRYDDDLCDIHIGFHSPGELLITDPLGRREGFDPVSGTRYYGIPNATYGPGDTVDSAEGEPPMDVPKVLDIRFPAEGEYSLSVTGTGEGAYSLEVFACDREGGVSYRDAVDVPILPNEVQEFVLDYSRAGGSQINVAAGFDGKGQRPRDVNRFLSYLRPSQVTTELPAGQLTYDLVILYDRSILVNTFQAVLNGQDITSSFSPSVETSEMVRLNLAPGVNTLWLSVDGVLPNGHVASDKDRLVFQVP
jgi:hypothetical protein